METTNKALHAHTVCLFSVIQVPWYLAVVKQEQLDLLSSVDGKQMIQEALSEVSIHNYSFMSDTL